MKFNIKKFLKITLITSIWINASEVFRYFVLVIPNMKSQWPDFDQVADMNMTIFAIWGLWDTLLTGLVVYMYWLCAGSFGNSQKSVWLSGTLSWAFVFVIFWVAAANMGLSNWSILSVTLPLSWVEMIVASLIANRMYSHRSPVAVSLSK